MRARLRATFGRFVVIFATTVVIFVGLSTLLGNIFGNFSYAVPEAFPIAGGATGTIPTHIFAEYFVGVAVLTIALSLLVGILNLLFVNAFRIVKGETILARVNSAIVLISFVIGLIVPALVAQGSIGAEWNSFMIENVQTSIES